MSGFLALCETYFGCRGLYEVLQVTKSSNEKEIRKAYHKLSLLVHPDRVAEDEKHEATEKFKVLGKIYSILSHPEKKAAYDETGTVDEDDEDWSDESNLASAFFLFKKITDEDITNYEKSYKGSELEIMDLKKAYVNGKGDWDYILEMVPFTHTDEEDRLGKIIRDLIDKEEVPEFDEFVNEDPHKRILRKKKAEREFKLHIALEKQEKLKKKKKSEDDSSDPMDISGLAMILKRRQQEREGSYDSFIDGLAAKYASGPSKRKSTGSSKRKTK